MNEQKSQAEYQGKIIGKIGTCVLIAVPTPDGKEHIEATCSSKEARDHLAAILEQECILRVNPKVLLDDIPDMEPETPAEPEPVSVLEPEPVSVFEPPLPVTK
ncbi:hypothetical protein ES705_45389 [subsurface metagenome]